tara:strand:+ start:1102 stop:1365 length:264 start_codon:yes stop_codon:yes gene_type:complete
MVVDGDIGEIYSYPGAGGYCIEWKDVIDDTDSKFDCTVLRAEAVIVISQMGWKLMGEERHPDDVVDCIYVRTCSEYFGDSNPWAEKV